MLIAARLLPLLCWLFVALPVGAATLEEAKQASRVGDYERSAAMYHILAEQGNAQAQRGLAISYERGRGVSADKTLALYWYEASAAQEYVVAQFDLALAYRKGTIVPKDFTRSLHWMQRAAVNGHQRAKYGMGIFYLKGLGVPKDKLRAYMWFHISDFLGIDRGFLWLSLSRTQRRHAQELAKACEQQNYHGC